MDETNLLNLIKPWLDTNYQITTKFATVSFSKKKMQLNMPFFDFSEIESFYLTRDKLVAPDSTFPPLRCLSAKWVSFLPGFPIL
jgi:hypothetical protein